MACDEMSRNRFVLFVELINKRPMLWTLGLMIPAYVTAFLIAFVGLAIDPHLSSPLLTVALLALAALIVMTYHWLLSRFQCTSSIAQAIQFFAGLIPMVGGLMVLLMSHLAVT